MTPAEFFAPDHARYDGVRPVHVWMLRAFYFLMAAFLAPEAWGVLLAHEGPWDPVHGAAWAVWAAYPTLAVLGLIHPLRMLPLMLFMIGYKLIWLLAVAFPMWRAGTLEGTPTGAMARVYLGTFVAILAVPWGYVGRHFILARKAGGG